MVEDDCDLLDHNDRVVVYLAGKDAQRVAPPVNPFKTSRYDIFPNPEEQSYVEEEVSRLSNVESTKVITK